MYSTEFVRAATDVDLEFDKSTRFIQEGFFAEEACFVCHAVIILTSLPI